MFNPPKTQRNRRKSAPGLDHIKHRRTRSGCFTCRNRRVKCDEARPICERCKKGKRECNYPEPSKGTAASGSKEGTSRSEQASPNSSNEDDDDEEDMVRDIKLETIADESEDADDITLGQLRFTRPKNQPRHTSTSASSSAFAQGSETPSFDRAKSSSSPSVSTGTSSSLTPAVAHFPDLLAQDMGARPEFSRLPADLQFYLNYYVENITHYHYCMLTDSGNFYKEFLPMQALQNEALLYALVGFAAYHHTLKNPEGQIKDFLQYYHKSVTLLLGFLGKKEKNNIGTIMTILQLATIEEYLGDWVSLMGHQKAAMIFLKELFTPQTVTQSPIYMAILTWYVRFDVFVGLIGSFETTLPTQWFTATIEHYEAQTRAEPEKLLWKIEERSASLRLVTVEMSILYGQGARGELSQEDYFSEHRRLSNALHEWKVKWDQDPALADPSLFVRDFDRKRSPDPDDIVDPYAPGVLYHPPLFASTLLHCEWHSIIVMHESQGLTGAGPAVDEEQLVKLGYHAYQICRIFETVEMWPEAPSGTLIIIQACLAIAALFLPRDSRHHKWIRRKFALLETLGYIFPLTMRMRMAELFGDHSYVRWWLPNDEGLTPLLKSLRLFADERNATATTPQSENLREIRHIFAKMQLGGLGDSPQSDESTQAGGKGKGKEPSV